MASTCVPLRHGVNGAHAAALRPLSAADALAIAELQTACPPAILATFILEKSATRLGDVQPASIASLRKLTGGDRERLLLGAYAATFGQRAELVARCADCGELAELDLALANVLAAEETGPQEMACTVDNLGVTVRLPDGEDLEACSRSPEAATDILFNRCVAIVTDGPQISPAAVRERIAAAVDQALRSLDPLIDALFDFACPACAAPISARLDALALLLARLPSAAALHAGTARLARAYGWREADIMALPVARHADYAARIGAA